MALLETRAYFKPFDYPEFYEIWVKAQAAHWSPFEVQMDSDVDDWKTKLTEAEKNLVGNLLKSFAIAEIHVEDYWASRVGRFFRKPEIQMVAHTFAATESTHAVGYAYLNDSLGLEDYRAFLNEPAMADRINRMMQIKGKNKADIARSLAVFSAFIEGVSLFSSFLILLSFTKRNLLKGVGQIISWSVLDEQFHSQTGIKLLNIMKEEYEDIWTDDLKKDIYDAARLTVKQEDAFIDKAFELGEIDGLRKEDVKAFIRHRANDRLKSMGLKSNWNNIDKEVLERVSFFEVLINGQAQNDFFASKDGGSYSKNVLDFNDVWEIK